MKGIFGPVMAHASKYNLRMIAVNMCDYSGSTPYTHAELASLSDPDVETQASAVRKLGRDIAAFMAYICKTKDIPPLPQDSADKSGGLVLLTWSLYTMGLLSMFGDPQTLDDSTRATLEPFLRKAIIYGER